MKSINISGLTIQADQLTSKPTKEKAMDIVTAINAAIGGLNGNPIISGYFDIDDSQIELVGDEDEDEDDQE